MKTERSIKELLELMLEYQGLYSYYSLGLCHWTFTLLRYGLLLNSEYCKLKDYIDKNRPSKYSSLDAYFNRKSPLYWKSDNIEPRIKWIKKHIKLNS
jgi:hypothetical protein